MNAGGWAVAARPGVGSDRYERDLEAARRAWSDPAVLGAAGAFVFLTYLTLPPLVAVRSGSGAPARSFLDGGRERVTLCRLVGLDDAPPWNGGIRNDNVRRLAAELGDRHRRFTGMRAEFLEVMAAVIAVAPLRVRPVLARTAAVDRTAYWRYMREVMALIGVELPTEEVAVAACQSFVDTHAGRCESGRQLFAALCQRHPDHVAVAVRALFEGSRAALDLLLLGSGGPR
jgi:hypothetical protein